MISKLIHEECTKRITNFRIACIDYQAAFEGVPHRWIEKLIKLVEAKGKTVKFRK